MLFEDDNGELMTSEEVNDLLPWEMDERNLHVYEDELY
jgi:hypothetical protein